MIHQTMPRFEGRTVFITGAAGAIGQAAAYRFVNEGAEVALIDRDQDQLMQVAARMLAEGHAVLPIVADVANEESVLAAITQAEHELGQINIMFNSAGIGGIDCLVDAMPVYAWDQVIAINLRGIFLCCKYGVPALRRAGGGAIVNMGSSTGRHDALPGSAAYMASKSAVEALTKSLALQGARDHIRVNAICPGIIQTALSLGQKAGAEAESFFERFAARIPLGYVGQPENVAAAVAFLASEQASQITGAALLIDGGQTMRRWISAPDLD